MTVEFHNPQQSPRHLFNASFMGVDLECGGGLGIWDGITV